MKSTRTCWLSLGSLVNKLSNSVRNNSNRNYVNEGKKVLKEILQHLRAGMGDTCRLTSLDPATQHYTLASLLDTVKVLSPLLLQILWSFFLRIFFFQFSNCSITQHLIHYQMVTTSHEFQTKRRSVKTARRDCSLYF